MNTDILLYKRSLLTDAGNLNAAGTSMILEYDDFLTDVRLSETGYMEGWFFSEGTGDK